MKPQSAQINPIFIWALSAFYKILALTWRKKIVFSPEFESRMQSNKPVALSYYHQDVNALVYIAWKYNTATIASDSKDGQLIAQVLENFGAKVARGSSRTNPIKALKGFIRLVRDKKVWAAIAVDGPKGPPQKIKPGITQTAKLLKSPIFTLRVACTSKWNFEKSWDQSYLPKPFSKVVYYFGPGVPELSKESDPKDPKLLESLEKAMSRNKKTALGYL